MNLRLPLSTLLFLGACQESEHSFAERAKSAVAKNMIDPSSVQYRDVVIKRYADDDGKHGDRRYICGQFNAKNRLGAYTGFKLFRVSQSEGDLLPTIIDRVGDQTRYEEQARLGFGAVAAGQLAVLNSANDVFEESCA